MKWLKEIWYFLITGWYRKPKRDRKLDILGIYIKNVPIRDIEVILDGRYSNSDKSAVYFEDGTSVIFKNNIIRRYGDEDGKTWRAWLTSGTIYFTDKSSYNWSHSTPSWEIIFKYKWLIKKQKHKEQTIKRNHKREQRKEERRMKRELKKTEKQRDIEFVNSHIPLKVSRKMKLEKINEKG